MLFCVCVCVCVSLELTLEHTSFCCVRSENKQRLFPQRTSELCLNDGQQHVPSEVRTDVLYTVSINHFRAMVQAPGGRAVTVVAPVRVRAIPCEIFGGLCGTGKAISITYSERESVALHVRHAKRMRQIILSCSVRPAVPYFCTLSYKRHDFRKKSY
jgi:hypothetical protein